VRSSIRLNIRRCAAGTLSQLGSAKRLQLAAHTTIDHQGRRVGRLPARVHHCWWANINSTISSSPTSKFPIRLCAGISITIILPGRRSNARADDPAGARDGIDHAYRVRGHLIADIDPLHAMPLLYHPELDIETLA